LKNGEDESHFYPSFRYEQLDVGLQPEASAVGWRISNVNEPGRYDIFILENGNLIHEILME